MTYNNSGLDELACYICHSPLKHNPTTLSCMNCQIEWPIQNTIPDFVATGSTNQYIMAGQSNKINQLAKEEGWRFAARDAANQTNNPEYQYEYIVNEARADFKLLLPLTHDNIVLDIGSGWGTITTAFSRHARHVFALDVSRENLEFTRYRLEQEGLNNCTLLQTDATKIPLPRNSCDIALLVGVLEWVAWGSEESHPKTIQANVLQSIYDVLAPGGCLYIGIENRFSYKYFLGAKEPHTGLRFVSLLPFPLANIYSKVIRGRYYREITHSLSGIKQLIRESGFKSAKIYFPVPGYQNFRFLTSHDTKGVSKYLFDELRNFPKYKFNYYLASMVALQLKIHKQIAPCFSIIAYKHG